MADKVNELLPVKVSSVDAEQNPCFMSLLSALSEHITPSGISKTVKHDLEEVEETLKHEKYTWLQQHITYLELQEVLLDLQLRAAEGETSESHKQYEKSLKTAVQMAEIGDYLECNLSPDQPATLLGLTKQYIQETNPQKKHMQSLQQRLIPDIEERLRKKCENLVSFHEPGGSESAKLSFAKSSQFPGILEAEMKALEEEKKMLARDRSNRDKQFWQYYQALMESLAILEELITKHRLQSQADSDTITSEWLAGRCDAMYCKIKLVELRVLCDTYYAETVQALKTIRRYLDVAIHDNQSEMTQAEQALKAYQSVGMGFDDIVQDYSHLKSEIENKKWALSELKQSLDG